MIPNFVFIILTIVIIGANILVILSDPVGTSNSSGNGFARALNILYIIFLTISYCYKV